MTKTITDSRPQASVDAFGDNYDMYCSYLKQFTQTTCGTPLTINPISREEYMKLLPQTNYSEVCDCVTTYGNITVCKACAQQPIELSINNMPEDVSLITTPQLTNLANDAYVGRMALRPALQEVMHEIRLECIDELERRHNRCKG